jgi:hypothetical protein
MATNRSERGSLMCLLVSSQKDLKNTPHKPNRIKGPISSIPLFQNLRVKLHRGQGA